MEFYQCGLLHSKSWDGYWLLSEISFGACYLTHCKYLSFFLVRNGKELFKKKVFLDNKMFCYVLTLVRGNNQRGRSFVFPRNTFYICRHYSFENLQLLKSKSELPRVRWHFFFTVISSHHPHICHEGKHLYTCIQLHVMSLQNEMKFLVY